MIFAAPRALALLGAIAKSPLLRMALSVFSLLCIAGWAGFRLGYGAGHTAGIEVGRDAARMWQAEQALEGARDAMRDRQEAERETNADWDRANGDLERLCDADPACRDRHGLRLDGALRLVDPGHAGNRDTGPRAQRDADAALPAEQGDER